MGSIYFIMNYEIQTKTPGSFVIVDNGADRYMGVLKEVFWSNNYLCCRLLAGVPCGKVETNHYKFSGGEGKYPYEMTTRFIGHVEKIIKLQKKEFYEEYLSKCCEISRYNEGAAYPSDY